MSTSVTVTAILWVLSPIFTFLVNKLLSYLNVNLSSKLWELKQQIIPSLEQTLRDVTEQIILRGAEDESNISRSQLEKLGALAKDLKSALYEAEDVLDDVKYRQIEKELISGPSITSWVQQAMDDCIAHCKRSSFGQKLWQCAQNQNQKLSNLADKLQQCAKDLDLKFWGLLAKLQQYAQYLNQMFWGLLAKLQQYAQYLNQMFWGLLATLGECVQSLNRYIHQEAAEQQPVPDAAPAPEDIRVVIEQTSTAPPQTSDASSNLSEPNALPNSAGSTTESRGDHHHGSAEEAPTDSLVQIIRDWLVYGFSSLWSCYLLARRLRDWHYELVGIKVISLRKRMNNIEYIFTESKKSPLLNQSSSNTPKDGDKESSSSCTVKNSAKASSSTKKEIDDMHRNIEEEVFGRQKDREHISNMLRNQPDADAASSSTSKPYTVIGIYGIAGSGKTTLAKFVCAFEKHEGKFNPIMFIHVGNTISLGDIFRDMLGQIKQQHPSDAKDPNESEKTESRSDKHLQEELKKELQDKCFLLVLDDVWIHKDSREELDILLDTLKAARRGSSILVTSQKKDAAVALGAQQNEDDSGDELSKQKDGTYRIPDLEENDYLSLFRHHAQPHGALEEYGKKIANRLCRSPIAAVTLGKQLQMNRTIKFWKRTANLEVLNKTIGALWWSYQQLSVDIRRCFAYCSTFPRGYVITPDELVRIWIAQGFVSSGGNSTEDPEDIGQIYFDELLTFSFLQPRKNKFYETETFTIHDLLHELAEKVSGSEFFRIDFKGSLEKIPRGVCHLFIKTNNSVVEVVEKIVDMENLRTLIIKEHLLAPAKIINGSNHDSEKLLELLFMRLTKLRVLIIEKDDFESKLSVPACINRMKHLRYLALRFRSTLSVLILPSTLGKLYHIEIIDLPCQRVSGTEGMDNLINLRHINGLSFPNIGKLTSLRTLTTFIVKKGQGCGLKQLKDLNKLQGTLEISGLENAGSKEEALEAHLNQKDLVRELVLDFGGGRAKTFGPDVEAEVLEGLCPPKGLQTLRIMHYRGSRYPTWMLSPDAPGQLQRLVLCGCSQLPSTIPKDSKLFIGLRYLNVTICDWDRLPENMDCLLSLQRLNISWCPNMELLPKLPVQSLKQIAIVHCGDLCTTCRKRGHENWRKIQEIPKRSIQDGFVSYERLREIRK